MPQILIRLQHEAEKILGDLLQSCARIAILDVTDRDDAGDALTALGTLHLMSRLGKKVVCIQSSGTYDRTRLRKARPDCILIQGGSCPSGFPARLQHRAQIAVELHDIKMIQLPQSVYSQDDHLKLYTDAIRAHRDFTALVPEKLTYDQLKEVQVSQIRLCPDLSFCCPIQQAPRFISSRPGLFLRPGSSSGPHLFDSSKAAAAGVTISNWNESPAPDIAWSPLGTWADRVFVAHRARSRVMEAILQFAPYRHVITDRLYAAILSYMMGKDTVILKHPCDRTQQVLDEWLPDSRGFKKAKTAEEAFSLVKPPGSKPVSSRKFLIAIYSCQKNRLTRLAAIRNSWAAKLPANVEVRYFVGGGKLDEGPDLKADEVVLSCPDSYDDLPKKTISLLRYAVRHFDFDHLIKVDDDTQVISLDDVLFHAAQGDYVGSLKGNANNPLHHLRRDNSQNTSPVPMELLKAEFMVGPMYCLSRRCAEYLAAIPESDIKELHEPVAYEDMMIGRLVSESERFSVYNVPGLVRPYSEPATVRRHILSARPGITLARTDYPVALQRVIATLLRFIPGRLFEPLWNFAVTNIDRVRRRLP